MNRDRSRTPSTRLRALLIVVVAVLVATPAVAGAKPTDGNGNGNGHAHGTTTTSSTTSSSTTTSTTARPPKTYTAPRWTSYGYDGCAFSLACRNSASGDGRATASSVLSSAAGPTSSSMFQDFDAFWDGAGPCSQIDAHAEISIDHATVNTAVTGGGHASGTITARLPGGNGVDPIPGTTEVVIAEARDGDSVSQSGLIALDFHMPSSGTSTSIGMNIDFDEVTSVAASTGDAAAVSLDFAATVTSLTVTCS